MRTSEGARRACAGSGRVLLGSSTFFQSSYLLSDQLERMRARRATATSKSRSERKSTVDQVRAEHESASSGTGQLNRSARGFAGRSAGQHTLEQACKSERGLSTTPSQRCHGRVKAGSRRHKQPCSSPHSSRAGRLLLPCSIASARPARASLAFVSASSSSRAGPKLCCVHCQHA